MVDNRRFLTSENHGAGRASDIYEAVDCVNVFADGIARVFTGPVMTKLEYFRTTEVLIRDGVAVEQREVFMRLTLPTVVFVEGSANILAGLGESLPGIVDAANNTRPVIEAAIQKVQNVTLK
jgi:hypothetical protein